MHPPPRERGWGIVYVDENCYGPDGYYAERPGWQQVADAAAGSSFVMGRAVGCRVAGRLQHGHARPRRAPVPARSCAASLSDRYRFRAWSSDAHVAPLYYSIVDAWDSHSGLVSSDDYCVRFADSVFGSDLRVLAPVVRYDDPAHSPRWASPPVPFCHHEFRYFSAPGGRLAHAGHG